MQLKVEVRGDKKLINGLRKVSRNWNKQVTKQTVKKVAKLIRNSIRREAPVYRVAGGRLKKSIKYRLIDGGKGAEVYSDAPYAKIVNEGHPGAPNWRFKLHPGKGKKGEGYMVPASAGRIYRGWRSDKSGFWERGINNAVKKIGIIAEQNKLKAFRRVGIKVIPR